MQQVICEVRTYLYANKETESLDYSYYLITEEISRGRRTFSKKKVDRLDIEELEINQDNELFKLLLCSDSMYDSLELIDRLLSIITYCDMNREDLIALVDNYVTTIKNCILNKGLIK